MESSYVLSPDLHVLPCYVPVPGIGLLPVNAFLVTGPQPYLVDTGLPAERDPFLAAVEGVMDPSDLRWIYLTHADSDHVGALMALLDRAPRAKLVTTFVGLAKLQLGMRMVPPDRVRLCNPGERLDLGDRTLTVGRPPTFDSPETTVVHDSLLRAFFSSDCFGSPLEAPVPLANDLPSAGLRAGQALWAAVDSPWIHNTDRTRFAAQVRQVQDLSPEWILSAHLPPARGMADALCANLALAPEGAPFQAPDQAAFEAMVRGMTGEAPAR